MKAVIAIPQMGKDLFRKYMKSKYQRSLNRAGLEVRWIELEDPDACIQALLQCDGLLLPGGADIAPHLYGQEPTSKCGKPNPLRDRAEWQMLDAFLPTGKPILCICRGLQLLNVYFGGTLHQDIKAIQKCAHADFKSRATGCHRVSLTPGTGLHAILGDTATVNSLHHQAADTVGESLLVAARSEDGIVEALELEGHPFCVAVQWHPEHMSKKSPLQQNIFHTFAEAVTGK